MQLVTERSFFQFNFHPKGRRFQNMTLPDAVRVDVLNDKQMVEEGLRIPRLPKVQRQWFQNRDKEKFKTLKKADKLMTKTEIHQAFAKHANTLLNWGGDSKITLIVD